MPKSVKHKFVSAIPDGTDATIVRPSNWNDDHDLTDIAASGANSDITSLTGITGGISSPDYIQFDTTYATTLATGQMGWNGNNTLGLGMSGGNIVQEIGLQTFIYGKASATITKGQLIKKTGANGSSGVITFAPTTANMTNSTDIIGIAAENIANNDFGYIMSTGNLRGFNTTGSGSGETWLDGDTLYYNPTGNGLMTKTKPSAPNSKTEVAVVTNAGSGGSGSVVVEIIHGSQLGGTDSNVQITSPTSGQTVVYNGTIWTNSNAPTISGGTINGTTIGATTPSTVNATTITGQTARLNGTGQNLYIFSEQFNNAAWTTNALNVTVTANNTTAPDGTLTADKIIPTAVSGLHLTRQFLTVVSGITYTQSIYAKASEYNVLQITLSTGFDGGGQLFRNILLSTGTLGNGTLGATVTSVGNNWYKIDVTATATASVTNGARFNLNILNADTASANPSYTGDGTSGLFLWGAQIETGSTANTYIPTTSAAVYGTPTLSFSGVSTIGLEQTGALYLQPAGTGALQAQATTSSATGGNARGANAVDWQTLRDTAARVASATSSVVSGGSYNTANAQYGVVAGGGVNTASGFAGVVSGGYNNTASGIYSGIVCGQTNTSAGYYNFIGAGFTNSGTSGSAVTTQSATMNATTAVTLSGSNASIKVGQYITGTSIAGDTYVAAISGTSLTLSKVASGSSTSTLSFFTPHGVVVGGGNNQATGSYSFIGGGGDAGTAANRNVASGDFSVVCGGRSNTASGNGSFVGGGGVFGGTVSSTYPNTASGIASSVIGGLNNTASGQGSCVNGGYTNTANSNYSTVTGGSFGTTRSIAGYLTLPACDSPISSAVGINQSALLILSRQTTDATATALASNSSAASTTNQVILPNNSAYFFRGEVISGVTGGGDTKGWTIEGVIKRGANAASTALVGTPTVTSSFADAGASTWTIAVTADTTNGGLRVTFTGQASTTIRTVCQIRTTEMTY